VGLSSHMDMRYQLTPINTRPWLLDALSLRLIESHYENQYGGALRRLNAITEQLDSLAVDVKRTVERLNVLLRP